MKSLSVYNRSSFKVIIGIAISSLFLYITVSKVNINETESAFKNFNYFFIFLAVAAHMLAFVARAIKWKILLDNIKKLKTWYIYKIITIGFMFNNILPFRIGEITRSHLVGRDYSISRSSILGTIFIEKISDALVLILILLSLGLFYSTKELTNGIFYLSAVLIVVIILVAIMFINEKRIYRIIEILAQKNLKFNILKQFLNSFINGLRTIKNINSIVKILLTSLLVWFLEAVPYYILSIGFNFNLNFFQLLLVCSFVNIALLIPASPGYIGTFHFFCVLALGVFGINQNIAFSYSIVTHLVLWIPITLIGFLFFILRKKGLYLDKSNIF